MEKLNILRLEVNYFLSRVELILGCDEKSLFEEAFDMLVTFYLFNHNEEFCEDYIERLESYIEQISQLDDLESKLFKRNIPTILILLDAIKCELQH